MKHLSRTGCAAVLAALLLPGTGCRTSRLPRAENEQTAASAPVLDSRPPLAMRFVDVPAGVFVMGAPVRDRPDDPFTDAREDVPKIDWSAARPARMVVVPAFQLSAFEVTQHQWTVIMGTNPSGATAGLAPQPTENYPVENVSWTQVQEFIRRLNARDRRHGFRYRLPTEAEWEYACRAGSGTSLFCFGNSPTELGRYAWFRDNSPRCTRPVGLKEPNAFGLYDMHGNVMEWCRDWYRPGYMEALGTPVPGPPTGTSNPASDLKLPALQAPQGPAAGRGRVARGGAWNMAAIECVNFARNWAEPNAQVWNIGFRLVREKAPAAKSASSKVVKPAPRAANPGLGAGTPKKAVPTPPEKPGRTGPAQTAP
ncbi:MAG: SUMF1/EgtB/PvdO family nonheme iron enzyme [Kiritimatiellaeota bacterium]|nr:SUMF1/EgtB/PvdO family nonheme iron enzyme [Kiritimatiellota bacterium]